MEWLKALLQGPEPEWMKEYLGVRGFIWASTDASDEDIDAMAEEARYFSQVTPYRLDSTAHLVVRLYKDRGLPGIRDQLDKLFKDAAAANLSPFYLMDFKDWLKYEP